MKIDRDAVLAIIKNRIRACGNCYILDELTSLYHTFDSIEVKEVDLDFQRFAKEMDAIFALPSSETKNTEEPLNWEYAIAKHFFELGLSANNPITATDRVIAEEIIINLKRVEKDYRIDLTKEIEWVRNQVKKGEDV